MSTKPTSTSTLNSARNLPGWPQYSSEEMNAVADVLRSGRVNYWTGTECRCFEQEYAAQVGVKHAIAAANGTLALEMALRALGITERDEVIVTPRSFMASVSCVVSCGARPVFADVDRDSGNITAESIARVTTARTRAVVLVHLAGWPCEMDPILEFAADRGLAVIEDCAQAHGAMYRGRAVGSMGAVGSFSFCQDKIITTGGEGGMVVTDDQAVWERMWSLKDHGKSYDACFNRQWPPGFRWLHESFGSNYRMTEMQAAIGRRQLHMLPTSVAVRQRHAARLQDVLSRFELVRLPVIPGYIRHAFYKYYCYVNATAFKPSWCRNRVMAAIAARGVPCFSGSCSEIYMEKAVQSAGFQPAVRLPVARELGETSLMFLVHPTLTDEDITWAGEQISIVLKDATR